MFHVLVVRADGTQWRPKHVTIMPFRYIINGGCYAATIKIAQTRDLPRHYDRLEIWDNLKRLWFGQIEDIGNDSNTGEITIKALGYSAYLKEISIARHWIDTGFAHWGQVPPTPPTDSWQWDSIEKDNNNRLFFRIPRDQVVNGNLAAGLYYRRCNTDAINQTIHSIEFTIESLAEFDSAESEMQLNSYSSNFSDAVNEFALGGSGAQGPTGTSDTITAAKKALAFFFDGQGAHTPTTDNYVVKITSVRVNGLTGFESGDTPKADDFIKDILTNFASEVSTDQSDIAAGTFTITDMVEDGSNCLALINRINEVEDYHWGFYEIEDSGGDEKPKFQYKAIERGTVDYTLDQTMGKLKLSGTSVENVFNAVRVKFRTTEGRTTSVTRTATVALLDDVSRTKTAEIRVDTESTAKAQEAGDAFLAEHGRLKVKGSFTITGDAYHNSRGFLPAWEMRPGEIVHIRDLDPTPETLTEIASGTVMNGRNVFIIKAIDVDPNTKKVRLELDVISNRLDLLLARKTA